MSQFDDIFEDQAGPALMEHLGDAITYTPAGGSAVSITCLWRSQEETTAFADDGSGKQHEAIASINNDASTGVVAPAIGDSITKSSVTWFVREVQTSGALHRLRVARYVQIQRGRESMNVRRE